MPVLLALAFAAGRVRGRREGERLAAAWAPLEARLQVLRTGRCPVCGQELAAVGRTATHAACGGPPPAADRTRPTPDRG